MGRLKLKEEISFCGYLRSCIFRAMLPTYRLFQNEWVTSAVLLTGIFLLLALSDFASRKLSWSHGASRKLVHVLVGALILLAPFIFESKYPPMTLALVFILVNSAALRLGKLPGIHTTKRKTYGTIYFPVAFFLLSLFWWERRIVVEISLLLLTLADTAAALAGERVRKPEFYVAWRDRKTAQGTVTMFLISVLLVGFGTHFLHKLSGLSTPELVVLIPLSFFVAILATIAESVSKEGSDNLSVPLVTALGYDLFASNATSGEILILLAWILFSFVLSLGALRQNALTLDGALGAFVLGVFVFGIGRWEFMLPMGVFFVTSSLLSRIGKSKKEAVKTTFGKGSKRDVMQVFANGGVPLIISVWWLYSPSDWLYTTYLASVAAATADTWATEIGFFAKGPPRNSVTFRPVVPGVSGGVTLVGTLGGLAGSAAIAFTAIPFVPQQSLLGWVVIAGFMASMVDSVLGATIQGSYHCRTCQTKTEMSLHCDSPAALTKGSRFINNDVVNVLCTLTGGTILLLAL